HEAPAFHKHHGPGRQDRYRSYRSSRSDSCVTSSDYADRESLKWARAPLGIVNRNLVVGVSGEHRSPERDRGMVVGGLGQLPGSRVSLNHTLRSPPAQCGPAIATHHEEFLHPPHHLAIHHARRLAIDQRESREASIHLEKVCVLELRFFQLMKSSIVA